MTAEKRKSARGWLEEAAAIADRAAKNAERVGLIHPEDSESRDRMFARAREATAIAAEIRALAKFVGLKEDAALGVAAKEDL